MVPALPDGLAPLGAELEVAPSFALPSELQREHLWLLLASLLASYWGFGFCCREAVIFYRRKPWKGELHWLYSVTVANLFFLLCVYLGVETAQLGWELNRTFSGNADYIQTTRYVVSLHFLILGMGGFAELFFLYRACLVMDRLRWKLVGFGLFQSCAGLYASSNVLTVLGLESRRMEDLGNKVRCGGSWALLILGIYNTAWIWYKLVLSWRDRPLSSHSPVELIARGILRSSFVLTTLSVGAAAASSFVHSQHGIMLTCLWLNLYAPTSCFCVTWAINQRIFLRRKQRKKLLGEETTTVEKGGRPRPGRTVVFGEADDPANWRSDIMSKLGSAVTGSGGTGDVSSSRSLWRRGSAMSSASGGSSGGVGWRPTWGWKGVVKVTVEEEVADLESKGPLEEENNGAPSSPRRPSWTLKRGEGARGSKMGPEALFSDIWIDTSAFENVAEIRSPAPIAEH